MNLQEVSKTLTLFKSNQLIEIRSFGSKTTSGYFKNFDNLINNLSKFPNETYYFVLNDIKDDCYSREQNEKILVKPKITTSDNDIARRDWIFIDADPIRTTGVSATDKEKAFAKVTILNVYNYLKCMGFAYPIVADSGNGYHLLYKIDLKNDTVTLDLIKNFLKVLDMLFSNEFVSIDTSVFNASRITKLYGTVARKGTNTEERPHRESKILKVPDNVLLTSITLIQKVADLLPKVDKKFNKVNGPGYSFDIENFISEHHIAVSKVAKWSGGTKYILEECLFDSNHKSPDAAICLLDNGAIAYHCFHNSCQCYAWQDVRTMFEPNAYEKKEYQEYSRTVKPLQNVATDISDTEKTIKSYLRMSEINNTNRDKIVSLKTGIHKIDKKMIGLNKKEVSIVSGNNGSAKSTIIGQWALEQANAGFKSIIFSGELTSSRIKNWLQLQAAGRQNTVKGEYGENYYFVPPKTTGKIDAWLEDKIFIYNNDFGTRFSDLLKGIERVLSEQQVDIVYIDNLMSLDLSEILGDKNEKQSSVILRLCNVAKKYNVHIVFVCHPKKPTGFLRKADISGTSDLSNAVDNVFMCHRVNRDFEKQSIDFFGKDIIKNFLNEGYTNCIEVMKNRDLGVQDELIGLYFEAESKRLLNELFENKNYGWYDKPMFREVEIDSPFD